MAKNVIFVSHCSKDADFTPHIFPHLENLQQSLDVQVWTDKDDIRAGDQWNDQIDEALDRACLAVMLISPKFLNSKFVTEYEIPQLRKRAKAGLRIIPLQMKAASCPDWLKATDMRPKGDRTLFQIRKADEAEFESQMVAVVDEIRALLKDQVGAAREQPQGGFDRRANMPSVKLLCDALLQELPDAEDFARRITAEIARITGLDGDGVFNATRLFIEYHLLESSDPDNEATLELSPARGGEPPEALLELLGQFGKTANPKDMAPYDVLSEFFNRTLEREAAWQRYFEAVAKHGGGPKESIASVLRIHAQMGYIAPQSLVAGLLARFDNEWRPVLDSYQSGIPEPKVRNSAFESLQASQWNCWLMWGPSVPICTCEQWHGKFAFQYGFGDENNSLPVVELAADAAGLPPQLGALGNQLRAERRGAKVSELTARLRWGPWFLEEHKGAEAEKKFDLADANRRKRRKQGLAKYPAAPAQMSLYQEASASGLVLQLDEAEAPKPQQETRVYFSAYYWLIFLVAMPPAPGEAGKEGPALLRRKKYPEWEDRQNGIVRDKLWQDLLPVFVHANIGDPEAFRFQRQVLVQNALQLLREVWSQRKTLFHAEDVAAGIRFYLACASDYSGCGCPIRYAPERSLIQELRARLDAEPDREFAKAIQLPADDEKPEDRAPGLAGYFSACHMPELIAGYYDHVEKISEPD